MNHYPHHIGDYLKDTAHLDPLEDGIYRRMIDLYYTQEGPLEADTASLCRRLRLDVKRHGKTLSSLLGEFFKLNDLETRWHHSRCDREIEAYQAKADANRKNGKLGGRPKVTHEEPTNNPSGFKNKTQNNLNQNQNQNQEPIKAKRAQGACIRPPEVSEKTWGDFLATRKAKRAPLTQTALEGIAAEAVKAGWSLEAALRECCARGWQGLKADWLANIKSSDHDYGQCTWNLNGNREAGGRCEGKAVGIHKIHGIARCDVHMARN